MHWKEAKNRSRKMFVLDSFQLLLCCENKGHHRTCTFVDVCLVFTWCFWCFSTRSVWWLYVCVTSHFVVEKYVWLRRKLQILRKKCIKRCHALKVYLINFLNSSSCLFSLWRFARKKFFSTQGSKSKIFFENWKKLLRIINYKCPSAKE